MEELKSFCFFIKSMPKGVGEFKTTINVEAKDVATAKAMAVAKFPYNGIVSMSLVE